MRVEPKHVVVAVIALVLAVAFTVLRHPSSRTVGAARSGVERDEDAAARVSGRTAVRSAASARLVSEGRSASPRAARSGGAATNDWQEGHDLEKMRAFGEATLSGIVSGDKGPVAGAVVRLYDPDPMTANPPLREAVTDRQGSYTLEQLNDQDVRFILATSADGYAPEARALRLTGGSMRVNIRLQHGVVLSGVVRDAHTSAPVRNATLYQPSQRGMVFGMLGSVKSGALGEFTFGNAPPGSVKVLAECVGYRSAIKGCRSPGSSVEIAMQAGGSTIRGMTVGRNAARPEGGAKVLARCNGFTTRTVSAEDGTFELRDLPDGEYRLVATKGLPSREVKVGVRGFEVKEGVMLVVPSELIVTGKVVQAGNGRPMPGVRVHYSSPVGKSAVISDENGQFGFETVALDDYTMEVHERGYLPVLDRKSTGSTEIIRRRIDATAASDNVTIRMRPVPCVSGIAFARRNGKTARMPGAEVAVTYVQANVMEQVRTRTDPFGVFFVNLPGRRPGQAKVVATRRDMVAVQSTAIPTRREMKLLLRPTRLMGELVLSDKTPLSGVEIDLKYLFPDKRPADKSVRIEGDTGYANARGRFALLAADQQQVELVFNLPDGMTIAKVLDSGSLMRHRGIFIYDPVAKEILTDARTAANRQRTPGTRAQRRSSEVKPGKTGQSGQQQNR